MCEPQVVFIGEVIIEREEIRGLKTVDDIPLIFEKKESYRSP